MGHHYRFTQHRTVQACQSSCPVFQSQGRRAEKYHQYQQYEWNQWQCVWHQESSLGDLADRVLEDKPTMALQKQA